ncbi:MAG: hypothetical protein KBD15_02590 [Candidatus Magasanikbacteria bacterium]|nr:hypothetical protein [Candidatus Magasanikbacteria bacterium]
MQEFFVTLLSHVVSQLVGILGIFFVLGYAMSKVQNAIHHIYQRTVGWKGILFTAWIGTPIHELSHVIVAKLFRHRIEEVSFFKPNKHTGALGHVEHSYNKKSLYQQMGNFFIGAAPLIGGSLIVFLLLKIFFPQGTELISTFSHIHVSKESFFLLQKTLTNVWSTIPFESVSFWIFIFLSFCISSHSAPSAQDRRGMWKGFGWIIVLLIILNIIPTLLGATSDGIITHINRYTGILISFSLYTLSLLLVHYILVFTLLRIPYFLLKK